MEEFLAFLERRQPEALAALLANTALQQRIIDGEISLLDAAADVGVNNQDDLTSIQRLDEKTTPVLIGPPDEDLTKPLDEELIGPPIEDDTGNGDDDGTALTLANSINHIDPAETGLDANGWPKYLKVPADCPAPQAGIDYRHYLRATLFPTGGLMTSIIQPVARKNHGGGHHAIALSVKVDDAPSGVRQEKIAVPFTTPMAGALSIYDSFEQSSNWVMQGKHGLSLSLSVSYCPGDFTGITPGGKEPLHERCSLGNGTIIALSGGQSKFIKCRLEPGERYFYNLQDVMQTRLEKGEASSKPTHRLFAEADYVMAGLSSMSVVEANGVTPPYAGPCLQESPYPANYSGVVSSQELQNTMSRWHKAGRAHSVHPGFTCGRQVTMQYSCDKGTTEHYNCHDITGKNPPVTFTRECLQPNKLVWTKGYNQLVTNTYRCEVSGTYHIREAKVCAAHRQNEVSESNYKIMYMLDGIYQIKRLTQCQFDKEWKRYQSVLISSSVNKISNQWSSVGRGQRFDVQSNVIENPEPTNECQWKGKNYPLGTVMTQTVNEEVDISRSGTNKYVCSQRAETPALPRFAHVETGIDPLHDVVAKPAQQNCTTCKATIYRVTFKQP